MKDQPLLDLAHKPDRVDAPWIPRVIPKLNDSRFEPTRIQGDLPWPDQI